MVVQIQRKIIISLIIFLLSCFTVHAKDGDIESGSSFEDELLYLQEESVVSIAARKLQIVGKAPAIITVITEREIRDMGFQNLMEVLRTVPGVDVLKEAQTGIETLSFRGGAGASQAKVLLDGHSLNYFMTGSATDFFYDLPLRFVKRIEIIRGPGSALYGENAFTGVIDIITKEADEIDGIELYSGYGKYDTKKAGFVMGKSFKKLGITAFLNWYESNGLEETIDEDKMSGIDALQQAGASLFGFPYTPSSNAPGKTKDGRRAFDSMVKISYDKLRLMTYYRSTNREPFVGIDYSLVEDELVKQDQFMADLSYSLSIGDKITIKPRIFYDYTFSSGELKALPVGTTLLQTLSGLPLQFYPDGMKGIAKARTQNLGSDVQLDYQLLDNYNITLGVFYQWQNLDNPTLTANFIPTTQESLNGHMERLSTTRGINFIEEYKRNVWSVYMQHIWGIRDDMNLTAGIRHDQYNDFAGTTNPRFAFVWEIFEDLTLKALYGSAFRAPNPQELVNLDNPVLIGDKGLDPETVRTYELGLSYKFAEKYTIGTNYFYSVIRNQIVTKPVSAASEQFTNSGGLSIHGLEFEFKAKLDHILKRSYLFTNYTFTSSRLKSTDIKAKKADVPSHKGNIGINIGAWKYMNANLHTFISSNRRRDEGDTREDMPSYYFTNLHLTSKNVFKTLQASVKINNIFNKHYEDPSPFNTMPSDIPRPDRNIFFELSFKY